MTELFAFKLATVFGAGFLTSISPCVYPTLPLTVSFLTYQAKTSSSKTPTLLFFLGQTLSYVFLGFLAVKLGEIFGFSSQSFYLNLFLAALLILMAAISLTGYVPQGLTNRMGRLQKKVEDLSSVFKLAPFFIGFGAALVASPCTSPVLGSVLASVSRDPWSIKTFFEMLAYALGASLLVLVLGLGLIRAKNLPRSGGWLKSVHKATGVLILFAAFYYSYRAFELY